MAQGYLSSIAKTLNFKTIKEIKWIHISCASYIATLKIVYMYKSI